MVSLHEDEKNSLMEDKRNNEPHSSESQKAYLTGEFVVVL